ncbi:conserved protein of unknown function [Pseudodesulfovibrio profundus]|uniref:Uncharacterized protein n=1 Tax=Pseudodesulfovibrio profundus TaxID=57320 RepID=A0A2C8F919_9BACT|nr:hypothetical protein [Pseudodesulfovibrio profundus]SOB58919.1 conserved protein of unknown function [Pseudodesulfovibrio profundus]|tara:strand:- start:326 stop:862 length:537 start_codon:yes stop_codon:yes gene_type:complete
MKNFKIILICIVLAGVYFYNTNWFQSFFLYERFYENIVDVPFDVTKKGETLSIPLNHKFSTCYELNVAVPEKNLYHNTPVGPGALKYKFISEGQVLAEGLTFPAERKNFTLYRGVSLITILVFDLPFPGSEEDLSLELTVDTPMTFLNEFQGKIRCSIRPNYSADRGGCYEGKMRITQ